MSKVLVFGGDGTVKKLQFLNDREALLYVCLPRKNGFFRLAFQGEERQVERDNNLLDIDKCLFEIYQLKPKRSMFLVGRNGDDLYELTTSRFPESFLREVFRNKHKKGGLHYREKVPRPYEFIKIRTLN